MPRKGVCQRGNTKKVEVTQKGSLLEPNQRGLAEPQLPRFASMSSPTSKHFVICYSKNATSINTVHCQFVILKKILKPRAVCVAGGLIGRTRKSDTCSSLLSWASDHVV